MRVSVVVPTRNGGATLARCLDGVYAQDFAGPLDVLVVDSSSTDDTRDVVARYPARLIVIDARDFDHGDTRNLGALSTDGDLIAFLVQDAYPAGADWLSALAACFDDPRVAGACSRVVPRPDAGPLARRAAERDLTSRTERVEARIEDPRAYAALSPDARRVLTSFNDVSSCIRRRVWKTLPFARTSFGEDVLWARGAIEAGHTIVYEPRSVAVHSHEYDVRTIAARARADAGFNQAYFGRVGVRSRRDALLLAARAAYADGALPGVSAASTLPLRVREHLGLFAGARDAAPRTVPAATDEAPLRVLMVSHAMLPESAAGTEVVTLALARALQDQGHGVTILHRTADPRLAAYALDEREVEGVRVLRLGNPLLPRGLGDLFRNASVEQRFREVLRRERPHVVHFQHLLHLSATLVRACAEEGFPSVLTLHDYWMRCARVQMLRADGTVCTGPPPLLGCAACLTDHPGWIAPLRALSRLAPRALLRGSRELLRRGPPHGAAAGAAEMVVRADVMREALTLPESVVAPSRFLRDAMADAGLPGERTVVSDNGVDDAPFRGQERRAPDGRLVFGFVGSLVPHKGLAVLARAFERLFHPAAELHVHGDAESEPAFRAAADAARAAVRRPGLRFAGPFARTDVGRVFASLDVLVVPSLWLENSPLTVHEAFLAGVPVIASDIGGLTALVGEGRGGLLFPAGDDRALAAAMQRFVDEPGLAALLAAGAPRVKTAAESAREMEVRYRQAVGLWRGRRGSRTL